MQVDGLNNDDVRTGQTLKRALGLLSAVAIAAAAGLATVDVPESDRTPTVLKRDALEQGIRPASPAQSPAAPASGEMDPGLERTDQGNDHHG